MARTPVPESGCFSQWKPMPSSSGPQSKPVPERLEEGAQTLDRHGLEPDLEAHARQAYPPARGATARVTTQRCLPILRSRMKPSCS